MGRCREGSAPSAVRPERRAVRTTREIEAGRRRPLAGWAMLWASALVLTFAAGLAVMPLFFSDRTQTRTDRLDKIVPDQTAGWTVKTLPVAESEEARSATESILRYDDVVYRSYRRGSVEVQLYVAYWKPGSVPYGQAGVHTPDTCWVNAGWTIQDKVNSRVMECGDQRLKPSEWRRFAVKHQAVHVLFWHLVGGRVHTYDQYGWRNGFAGILDRVPNLFRDIRRYGFNLAQEQVFVRVSSNTPFDQLMVDPAFVELMRQLQPLGVFEAGA